VWLFDAHGGNYLAQVEKIGEEKTKLAILEKKEAVKPKTEITLAQALLKTKKMELILQKATELGMLHFLPVVAARSIVKAEVKSGKKLERWKKIIQEAAKQSNVSWIPSVSPLVSVQEVIVRKDVEKKILLSENKGKYLRGVIFQGSNSKRILQPRSAMILIGPEGGWEKEEEKFILDHGFEPVCLGSNILRAETAAIAALAILSHFWNT
jgi:16S rRNA (uracil1498-N3)-methyltransferase